jgi:hypothetical protein
MSYRFSSLPGMFNSLPGGPNPLDTRPGFPDTQGGLGGLALGGDFSFMDPSSTGAIELSNPEIITQPTVGHIATRGPEGVDLDPEILSTLRGIGDVVFRTTNHPDSVFAQRPDSVTLRQPAQLPEGTLTADAKGQREQRRINAAREKQGLPAVDRRGRPQTSGGRVQDDTTRGRAAASTDEATSGRRNRDSQSQSERRRVEDAGEEVGRLQRERDEKYKAEAIVTYDRRGRPLDRNGNIIKNR